MDKQKYISERIEAKKGDYQRYGFTQTEDNAMKTFFDLAQELESIEDFCIMCVLIPRTFFDLNARLYLIDPRLNALVLCAGTDEDGYALHTPPPEELRPSEYPYYTDRGSLVLTIRGNKLLIDQLPFQTRDDVIGLLEIYPFERQNGHIELFFVKYANRVGFNIHNKLIVEKNIEHLKFIRSLVADIEHNIIVPNMVYKLFLRHMRDKVMDNKEIEDLLFQFLIKKGSSDVSLRDIYSKIAEVNRGLTTEMENFEKHYKNMSLFIETLFRRSHFDKGKLVLRTKPCNMKKEVVQPQLERYMEQFKERGIAIDDRLSGIPEEEIINVVDVGLIAQVYANLFSNAIKYTEEVFTESGERLKYIAYGSETIEGFFGPGKEGVKYNVFSTGAHIKPEEREKIFDDGYRCSNVLNRPGTGHGLAFIKNAIELHGGVVGCEATQYGNNIYFIIPEQNYSNRV